MNIWKWIKSVGAFLRRNIRQVFLLLLFLLFLKFLAPKVYALIFGVLGPTAFFVGLLAVIIIVVLLLALDGGIKGLGPCALVTFNYKPDKCVNVACVGAKCRETTGPYPKWMGSWAFGSQAVSCTCPTMATKPGFTNLIKVFEKLKGDAGKIDVKEDVRKKIIEALGKDLTADESDKIKKIMDKIQRGEDLTAEDYDELVKMLEHP